MTSVVSPDIAPAGPRSKQRGIQLPQLLLSVLVVGVFALLAVWWQASTTARTPVVALASNVDEGEPLTIGDLTEIYISTDVPALVTNASSIDAFVGKRPVTDLSQGTLLTPEMFVGGTELLAGQAFAGLVLDGTRAPTGLVPGDRVQVLLPLANGAVDVVSPNALVESADRRDGEVRLRLRLDIASAQRVQTLSRNVVVIEISEGSAFWEEEGEPS